jgi:hypothetical protein
VIRRVPTVLNVYLLIATYLLSLVYSTLHYSTVLTNFIKYIDSTMSYVTDMALSYMIESTVITHDVVRAQDCRDVS